MKIYTASDHAGFELKEMIVEYLRGEGYEVIDKGAYQNVRGDDYPDYIALVAEIISANHANAKAIIFGGSGQGEAMVANRFSGVRAVVYYGQPKDPHGNDIIALSREHNNANVLSLGARFISEKEAKAVVVQWLETPFSGEVRHKRRIAKIDDVTRTKVCATIPIRTNLLGPGKRTKPSDIAAGKKKRP